MSALCFRAAAESSLFRASSPCVHPVSSPLRSSFASFQGHPSASRRNIGYSLSRSRVGLSRAKTLTLFSIISSKMATSSDLPFDPTSGSLDSKIMIPVDRSKMADVSKVPSELTPAVLLSCGSFSPPTVMHLRIFETARDYFRSMQDVYKLDIVGGFLSPVHNAYGKKSLVAAQDRVDMCKASLASSDWVMVDEWETKQNEWTRTRLVMDRFHKELNSDMELNGGREVRVLLLCGADILDSMCTPGVWIAPDLHQILGYGVACIKRTGSEPEAVVFDSDALYEHRRNIFLIREPVENHVSSTAVRRAIKRGQSIKYLVVDGVEDIIKKRKLWH